MGNIFQVKTLKGKVVGNIRKYNSMLTVVWSTGETMIFKGPATIVFHDGRNVLHVEFDGKALKTGAVIETLGSGKTGHLQPKPGKTGDVEFSLASDRTYRECLEYNRQHGTTHCN